MAPRALASGTISFGLVAIPVKLFSPIESQKSVRFNNVHRSCGTRVKYQYYCPTDDRLVERDELAKGYEFARGQYVLFTPEELKAIEPPATHSIEIGEFVPLEQVDPIYFEKPYYLGPDKGGAKPYRLLVEAMGQTSRAALGKYAARGKSHLILLRPFEGGLVMQQLRYADELRPFSEIPCGDAEVKEPELQLALQLIEQTANESFEPDKYEDEVRKQVWEMVERKVEGQEIVAAPEVAPKAQVIDLMEALKASLSKKAAKASGSAGQAASRRAAKKAVKKRSAKKKAQG